METTLAALDAAGAVDFPRRLMVNDTRAPEAPTGWQIQLNREPKSTRTNLWAAFTWAYELAEDRLLFFEDDIIPCRNAITWMAQCPIPADAGLVVFLDLRNRPTGSADGIYLIEVGTSGAPLHGLQAVVFPRRSLKKLLEHDPDTEINDRNDRHGDILVGKILRNIAIHVPCLATHVGEISTAHPGETLRKWRLPRNFRGADFDALTCALKFLAAS